MAHPAFHYPDIGVLGEDLVARWLQSSGWTILQRRWRCQWGELDLVAKLDLCLAFVEVKTRKQKNWDAGGLLAITPQKQIRLWQAAEYFLSAYPDLATYQCRFDVALVQHRKLSVTQLRQRSPTFDISPDLSSLSVRLGQAVVVAGYQIAIQEYLPAAFGN
jgi:putative endonuclease